jgi:NAD(P)-dependent dehydrogenase (short-subunit alcohol dehydrogenase family)
MSAGQVDNSNNGNGAMNPQDENLAGKSAKEIRAVIAATRDELGATIDAIEARLSPAHAKERVIETVHAANVGRVQNIAQHVGETVSHTVEQFKTLHADGKVENAAHVTSRPNSDEKAGTKEAGSNALKPITEQVVVVFGASSGIGRETALQFARGGAKVVVAARGQSGLDSVVSDIRRAGGDVTAVTAEASDWNQVHDVAKHAVAHFGRIDTWVHCAAVSLYASFEQTVPEEFRRVIEVNLIGAANGALAALPHLRQEGRGALIVISSVEGKRSLPYQSAYAASKHGIIGFLDALRLELQREGVPISVTNVMPAGINTPFFNKARTKLGVKPKPMPPVYEPSVVAQTILYAAENPTRDIVAGGGAKTMVALQRLSPTLMDAFLLKTGFSGQETDEAKDSSAPDNLFKALESSGHIQGDFSGEARASSVAPGWRYIRVHNVH